jgi:hypothetical protein
MSSSTPQNLLMNYGDGKKKKLEDIKKQPHGALSCPGHAHNT